MIPLDPKLAKLLEAVLHDLEDFVRDELAPHFVSARMDPESAAVIVHGWEGEPTATSYQSAVIRSGTALEQHGLFEDDARRLATRAVDFMIRQLWDADHGGWLEQHGESEGEKRAVTQGQALAALAEFLMVSGDFEVSERLVETFQIIQVFLADNLHGGYARRFTRDWRVLEPEADANDTVALAEGFALAFQALGTDVYRRRAGETLQNLLSQRRTVLDPAALRALSLLNGETDFAEGRLDHLSADRFANVNDSNKALTCLELWRITGNIDWLERVADFAGVERKPSRHALPDALRMEALLLKALYGAKK